MYLPQTRGEVTVTAVKHNVLAKSTGNMRCVMYLPLTQACNIQATGNGKLLPTGNRKCKLLRNGFKNNSHQK
jgi:hypothetical protein